MKKSKPGKAAVKKPAVKKTKLLPSKKTEKKPVTLKKPISKKIDAPTSAAISTKSNVQLKEAEGKKNRSNPYPIVAIGASAGGVEAISELLKNVAPDTGMAFIYIQHLDPTYKSMLSDILSKFTKMPVWQAKPNMKIQPNH